MTRSLFDPVPRSPVLTPEALRALGERILSMTAADTVRVQLSHRATGTARVANGEVQINDSGDRLFLWIIMQFGQRLGMALATSQIDTASLRQAVAYLERNARELPGDAVQTAMPIPPRHYLTNTTSHDSTLAAFYEQRHEVIETLVAPVAAAGLITSAFSGVMVQSRLYADKQGLMVAGQETDSEITVTAWNPDGKGSGWAGDAARVPRYFLARKPAFSIRSWCIVSAFASHFANSGPVMNDWLNAACSVNSFQSGVSRTFLNRST